MQFDRSSSLQRSKVMVANISFFTLEYRSASNNCPAVRRTSVSVDQDCHDDRTTKPPSDQKQLNKKSTAGYRAQQGPSRVFAYWQRRRYGRPEFDRLALANRVDVLALQMDTSANPVTDSQKRTCNIRIFSSAARNASVLAGEPPKSINRSRSSALTNGQR